MNGLKVVGYDDTAFCAAGLDRFLSAAGKTAGERGDQASITLIMCDLPPLNGKGGNGVNGTKIVVSDVVAAVLPA